jgi:hypothetical protein
MTKVRLDCGHLLNCIFSKSDRFRNLVPVLLQDLLHPEGYDAVIFND